MNCRHEGEISQVDDPIGGGWRFPSRVRGFVLIVTTALGLHLCYLLALPFLSPLVWALALAVLFAVFHRWLESRLGRPGVAASISVPAMGLIAAAPATFVGHRLSLESARDAEIIRLQVESGEGRRVIKAQPRIAPLAHGIEQKVVEICRNRLAAETIGRVEPDELSRFEYEGGRVAPESALPSSHLPESLGLLR